MASITVKRVLLVVAHLAAPTAAEELKTVGAIKCTLESNVNSPLEIKPSLKGGLTETYGSLKGALNGPLWPPTAAKAFSLEKKEGAFTCTLTSSGSKTTGSISTVKKIGGANIKGTVSSPAKWPMEPTGTVSVDKDIGPMSCTFKSATLPITNPKAALSVELGTLTLKQKIKEFDCSLVGTISEEGSSKMVWGNGKVAVKRTVDTPIGPVCGVLETKVDAPTKATGTVSLKKTLGKVCCNLQATSKGAFTCTFDQDVKFSSLKEAATTAAPKGGFFKSEVAAEGSTSSLVVALIGFAAGGIITFVLFRRRSETLTAAEHHLLA